MMRTGLGVGLGAGLASCSSNHENCPAGSSSPATSWLDLYLQDPVTSTLQSYLTIYQRFVFRARSVRLGARPGAGAE